MVDLFMAAGFTYFDTAYVYPGSEEAILEEYSQIQASVCGADMCISCGQCERACPQHLEIRNYLKQAVSWNTEAN